jgi:hypothetical protein
MPRHKIVCAQLIDAITKEDKDKGGKGVVVLLEGTRANEEVKGSIYNKLILEEDVELIGCDDMKNLNFVLEETKRLDALEKQMKAISTPRSL